VLALLNGDRTDFSVLGDLLALSKDFGKQGVRTIALSEKWPTSYPQWLTPQLSFPVLSDIDHQAQKLYGIRSLPAVVLIDANKKVASVDSGNAPVASATYTRQELETRLLGRIRYPRYEPKVKKVGDYFPDFLVETDTAAPFSMREVRGRIGLLVVSNEKCHACGGLSETLSPVIDELKKRGGVCIWEDRRPSDPAKTESPDPEFIVVRDPLGSLNRADEGLDLPNITLIGPEGRIRWIGEGPFDSPSINAIIAKLRT
jgi:peroxiredoxin